MNISKSTFEFSDDEWERILQDFGDTPNKNYKKSLERICIVYINRKKISFPDAKAHRLNYKNIATTARRLTRLIDAEPLWPGVLHMQGSGVLDEIDLIADLFELAATNDVIFDFTRVGAGGRMSLERNHLWGPLVRVWSHRHGNVRFSPTGPLMRFIMTIAQVCGAPDPNPQTVREAVKEFLNNRGE